MMIRNTEHLRLHRAASAAAFLTLAACAIRPAAASTLVVDTCVSDGKCALENGVVAIDKGNDYTVVEMSATNDFKVHGLDQSSLTFGVTAAVLSLKADRSATIAESRIGLIDLQTSPRDVEGSLTLQDCDTDLALDAVKGGTVTVSGRLPGLVAPKHSRVRVNRLETGSKLRIENWVASTMPNPIFIRHTVTSATVSLRNVTLLKATAVIAAVCTDATITIDDSVMSRVELRSMDKKAVLTGGSTMIVRNSRILYTMQSEPLREGASLVFLGSEFGGRGYSRKDSVIERRAAGEEQHAYSTETPLVFSPRPGGVFDFSADTKVELRNCRFDFVMPTIVAIAAAVKLSGGLVSGMQFSMIDVSITIGRLSSERRAVDPAAQTKEVALYIEDTSTTVLTSALTMTRVVAPTLDAIMYSETDNFAPASFKPQLCVYRVALGAAYTPDDAMPLHGPGTMDDLTTVLRAIGTSSTVCHDTDWTIDAANCETAKTPLCVLDAAKQTATVSKAVLDRSALWTLRPAAIRRLIVSEAKVPTTRISISAGSGTWPAAAAVELHDVEAAVVNMSGEVAGTVLINNSKISTFSGAMLAGPTAWVNLSLSEFGFVDAIFPRAGTLRVTRCTLTGASGGASGDQSALLALGASGGSGQAAHTTAGQSKVLVDNTIFTGAKPSAAVSLAASPPAGFRLEINDSTVDLADSAAVLELMAVEIPASAELALWNVYLPETKDVFSVHGGATVPATFSPRLCVFAAAAPANGAVRPWAKLVELAAMGSDKITPLKDAIVCSKSGQGGVSPEDSASPSISFTGLLFAIAASGLLA